MTEPQAFQCPDPVVSVGIQKILDIAQSNAKRLDKLNGGFASVDHRLDNLETEAVRADERAKAEAKYRQQDAEKLAKKVLASRWQWTFAISAVATVSGVASIIAGRF